jgi:hypothetical protein
MNRLIEVGFAAAGHWKLNGAKLACELTRYATQVNVLYAFVSDGEVKYIGKTKSSLATRMAGYRNPAKSQTTNVGNNERIKTLLSNGGAVEILVLADNGLLHYGQFHLNLAAGLEDDLIRVINPEWNGGRKERIEGDEDVSIPAVMKAEEDIALAEAVENSSNSFSFVLHQTYFRTGFFNVGVSAAGLIGADGETIELYLGTRGKPILGKINRTANINGTPRIMGGTGLRDWFQAEANPMDQITVDVLSPVAIRLKV